MHRLLARAQPSFDVVLLIESGPRQVTEKILRFLYEVRDARQVDVLTCYGTPPSAFQFERGTVYSVHDEEARRDRGAFLRKLAANRYTVLGFLCTGSPILQKWKWMLALRSSARMIVINQEAQYFGLDIWNLRSMRMMLSERLNPFGNYSRESLLAALSFDVASRLLAPFTVLYLLIYTLILHSRRLLRSRNVPSS